MRLLIPVLAVEFGLTCGSDDRSEVRAAERLVDVPLVGDDIRVAQATDVQRTIIGHGPREVHDDDDIARFNEGGRRAAHGLCSVTDRRAEGEAESPSVGVFRRCRSGVAVVASGGDLDDVVRFHSPFDHPRSGLFVELRFTEADVALSVDVDAVFGRDLNGHVACLLYGERIHVDLSRTFFAGRIDDGDDFAGGGKGGGVDGGLQLRLLVDHDAGVDGEGQKRQNRRHHENHFHRDGPSSRPCWPASKRRPDCYTRGGHVGSPWDQGVRTGNE